MPPTDYAARAFAEALIVRLHYEGWEHFPESRADVERAFRAAGIEHRLWMGVSGGAPAGYTVRRAVKGSTLAALRAGK